MNDSTMKNAQLLRSAQFRRGREEGWKKLERLVRRIEEKGIRSLSAGEAGELPLLYRGALSSLSVARSIALDRRLLQYLEDLSFRAYLAVYGPRGAMRDKLKAFFLSGFPRVVRAMRWHLLAAFAIFACGVAAGYALVAHDMEYYNALIPAALANGRVPGANAETLLKSVFAPWPGFVESFIVFANTLFRNNALVGILCFGLGFVLGLPTVFLLMYNGMTVGAMVALYADAGLAVDFIAWLSIHGVTEILAILLCGAAGFALAQRIVFPGSLTRLENLAKHGREAAMAAAGAVALFFVAGIIEGGFRQLIGNTQGRLIFAAASAAVWLFYFGRFGRNDNHAGD